MTFPIAIRNNIGRSQFYYVYL